MTTKWKALILVAVAIVSCPSLHAGQAAGREQIKALADEAAAVAAKWLKDEPIRREQAALAAKVRATKYDITSLPFVAAYMRRARSTPAGLFVINQVTRPLWTVNSEVAKAVLADFKRMHQKLARYAAPGKYKLTMPGFRGRTPPDVMMAAIARAQAQMKKNMRRLMLLKKRDREIYPINQTLVRLMLLSADPKEDKRLIMLLQRLESSGDWEFTDVLGAIASNVGKLGPKRAGAFYDVLLRYGLRVRMKKAKYARRFEIIVIASKGGIIAGRDEFPGIRILQTVNVLAKAAGKPEVVVPTTQQVNEFLKRLEARKKGRKR